MGNRTRKRKANEKPTPLPALTLEEIVKKVWATFNQISGDSVRLIADAQERARYDRAALDRLNGRLVGLLSADQIEAARISGCDPAIYAIEWIEIWREKMFPKDGVILPKPFDRLMG